MSFLYSPNEYFISNAAFYTSAREKCSVDVDLKRKAPNNERGRIKPAMPPVQRQMLYPGGFFFKFLVGDRGKLVVSNHSNHPRHPSTFSAVSLVRWVNNYGYFARWKKSWIYLHSKGKHHEG